jgi:hypothetical protein
MGTETQYLTDFIVHSVNMVQNCWCCVAVSPNGHIFCNGTIVNVNMNFWFLIIRISWHYWETNGRLATKCKYFFSLKCVLSIWLLAKIIWCLCVYCCNYQCEQATAGCCVTYIIILIIILTGPGDRNSVLDGFYSP